MIYTFMELVYKNIDLSSTKFGWKICNQWLRGRGDVWDMLYQIDKSFYHLRLLSSLILPIQA